MRRLLSLFLLGSILFSPSLVFGKQGDPGDCIAVNSAKVGDFCSLESYVNSDSIQEVLGATARALLGIAGSAALAFFVYGGFLWMTAAGEEKKIKQGWGIMIWTTFGIAALFASFAIVSFIMKALGVASP